MPHGVLYEQPGLTLRETPTIAPQSTSLRLVVDSWDDAMVLNLTPEQAWALAGALRRWVVNTAEQEVIIEQA